MKIIFDEKKLCQLDPMTTEFLRSQLIDHIDLMSTLANQPPNTLSRIYRNSRKSKNTPLSTEIIDMIDNKELEKAWRTYSKRVHQISWIIPNSNSVEEFLSIVNIESENGLERAQNRVPSTTFKRLLGKLSWKGK